MSPRRRAGVTAETGGSTHRTRAYRVISFAIARSVPGMPSHEVAAIHTRWQVSVVTVVSSGPFVSAPGGPAAPAARDASAPAWPLPVPRPNLPGCRQSRGFTTSFGPLVQVGWLAFRRVGAPVTSLAR